MTATYQLTVVTSYNGSWSIQKIPLVNDQSGSFIVDYTNTSESKLLIISSLTGSSSEYSPITPYQLLTTYYSTYNIYLQSFSYSLDFNKLMSTNQTYPNFGFKIYSKSGELIPQNGVKSITLDIYKWNTTNPLAGINQNIYFNQTNQNWVLNASNFQSLAWGQYYFTLTIKLVNDQTFTSKGLTFLIGDPNLSTSSSTSSHSSFHLGFINPELLFGVLVLIPLVRIQRRKK